MFYVPIKLTRCFSFNNSCKNRDINFFFNHFVHTPAYTDVLYQSALAFEMNFRYFMKSISQGDSSIFLREHKQVANV